MSRISHNLLFIIHLQNLQVPMWSLPVGPYLAGPYWPNL